MAEIEHLICVKHGNKIKVSNFYMASEVSIFSALGYIPICKKCLYEMVSNYYDKFKDMKLSIYYTCRKIDIAFDNNIYESALRKGKNNAKKVFQSYMVQYNSLGQTNNAQLPFDDGEHINEKINNNNNKKNLDKEIDTDIQLFWGFGFDMKDYIFLENELSEWKKTHKCDNQAELTLLKEICIKILEIRKKREEHNSFGKEQKELQDLMKTASVDPAKANAISSGQSVDRFGVWIKDIEQYRPADWWDKQEKYVDMDGIKPYIKNYLVRPIKNFFTGVKDFLIDNEDLSFKD